MSDCDDAESSARAYACFQAAFDRWLEQTRVERGWRSAATADAYERIWKPFMQWCVSQRPSITIESISSAALETYVLGRTAKATAADPLTARYAWRVLTVVDHVLQHHGRQNAGAVRNPAVRDLLRRHPAWRWANAPENETLPEHLDARAAAQLLAHLARGRRNRSDLFTPSARWQELRDIAVVSIHLGSGLTPAEARALKPGDLLVAAGRYAGIPWKVRVPASLSAPVREAPLAPWAGQVLARWLEARPEHGIGGELLFPSTRAGKPWSADGHALAVRRVLEAAGLEPQWVTGAAFRLRHTFALRQLRRGAADSDVADWLGVRDTKVMARYRRVLQVPVTDVI